MSNLGEIHGRMAEERGAVTVRRRGLVSVLEALILMNALYLAASFDPTNKKSLQADGDGLRGDLTIIAHDVLVISGQAPGEPTFLRAA